MKGIFKFRPSVRALHSSFHVKLSLHVSAAKQLTSAAPVDHPLYFTSSILLTERRHVSTPPHLPTLLTPASFFMNHMTEETV